MEHSSPHFLLKTQSFYGLTLMEHTKNSTNQKLSLAIECDLTVLSGQ